MGTTVERHTKLHLREGIQHFWQDHHRVNIEYAKYVGFALLALGLVGIPYADNQFLFFSLSALQSMGHLVTGMFLLVAVIAFDGSFARLANQVVGPFCMIIAAYGLSEMTPVNALFSLNSAEILFYMCFGLITALVGWGQDVSSFKHWWP